MKSAAAKPAIRRLSRTLSQELRPELAARASVPIKLVPIRWRSHAGGGVSMNIIPAQVADLGATNAPYAPVFVGGITEGWRHWIAPGVQTGSRCDRRRQTNPSKLFSFRRAPCGLAVCGCPTCPWRLTEYFFQRHVEDAVLFAWSWARTRLGARAPRIDDVGTGAPCMSVSGAVERVSDGVQWLLAPFVQPTARSALRHVNEFPRMRAQLYGLQNQRTKQFAA